MRTFVQSMRDPYPWYTNLASYAFFRAMLARTALTSRAWLKLCRAAERIEGDENPYVAKDE